MQDKIINDFKQRVNSFVNPDHEVFAVFFIYNEIPSACNGFLQFRIESQVLYNSSLFICISLSFFLKFIITENNCDTLPQFSQLYLV